MEATGASWTDISSEDLRTFCRDMLRICRAEVDFACLVARDHLKVPRLLERTLATPGQKPCQAGRSPAEGLGMTSPVQARVS